ncbi:MAG: sulfatase-like hydrolase/transferase [Phycisphaerales bacterium]|nr:MAG: sulfatase-like hydrolase/transferase [Phycisphaerales bacterium]
MSGSCRSRRDFLKAAGFVAAAIVTSSCTTVGAQGASRKPSILMIMVDDLGYGDLSSYGATDLRTPEIDRLVAAGIRFDNFYGNCPVCSPTRASLLTGCHPDLVGVPGVIRTHLRNNWGWLSSHAVLLPELLKPAGYHTAIIDKWHLGLESPNTPNDRGFDHFHGFLGDMMDDYYKHRRHGINYLRLNREEIDPPGHATDLFTAWAIDYIGERSKSKQPFFLYLAYNAPHTPIQPPADWLERVRKRQPAMADKRAKLVALIEHMDDGIGKVVAALRDCGASDNTLVIFTADNGGQLNVGASNGSLRAGKQDMYEGGIRVPMCAVWPGRIKPGAKSDSVALTMDLFPTICEAAGASVTSWINGRSILPTLLGKRQPMEDRFLFWVRREGGHYGGRAYDAARYGNYKLLQNSPFEPMQLLFRPTRASGWLPFVKGCSVCRINPRTREGTIWLWSEVASRELALRSRRLGSVCRWR